MPSSAELVAVAPVSVSITSHALAAELEVVDAGYAHLGGGVGALRLKLAPGHYQVRQRVGFKEEVHELEVRSGVESQDVELPPLQFASPIPLPGTSLSRASTARRPLEFGEGNLRIVLRAPTGNSNAASPLPLDHIRAETRRLRIESLDGQVSLPLADKADSDGSQDVFVASFQVQPGPYLLVQEQESGRQACMSVPVRPDRTTFVFSLALRRDSGDAIALQLGNSAMAVLRTDQLGAAYEDSLLRMEAARKALSRGGGAHGWSEGQPSVPQSHPQENTAQGRVENTLLDLIDLQLRLQAPGASPQERASGLICLERVSAVLGAQSADVLALRHALGEHYQAVPLEGPPLLKRSWSRLLAFEEGDTLADSVMPFSFQVAPSPVWFIWTEQPGVRAKAFGSSSVGAVALRRDSPAIAVSGDEAPGAHPVTEMLAQGIKALWGAVSERLIGRRMPAVTFENVESMLAALLKTELFRVWMGRAQKAFEEEGKLVEDESMRSLISSLLSMSDPTLVETLGAEAVAKSVLASLRLPRSQVKRIAKRLLIGVIARLEPEDRRAMLDVLRNVVDVAEAWLDAPRQLPPEKP